MKKIKNVSLMLFSAFVFICSAFIFVGCGDNKDRCKLYVFASEGGKVEVNSTNIVEFGDEGKMFTFKEDTIITLKAVPNEGYVFNGWTFTEDFEYDDQEFLTNPEIKFAIDDDRVVVEADFILNENVVLHDITLPNSQTYSVTKENGTGFTTSDLKVVDGKVFKFKVNLAEGYTKSNIIVKVNNQTVTAQNGVYSVVVNNDTIITVENVVKNTYNVYTEESGYTINPISTNLTSIDHGANFSFTINTSIDYDTMIVRCNGNLLTSNSGIYTIVSVKNDCKITVEFSKESVTYYTVSLPKIDGIVIVYSSGNGMVQSGGSVSFTITANIGNVDISNIQVSYNGNVVQKNNGVYTIYNITKTINSTDITVTGIKYLFEYDVIASGEGFDIVSETKKVLHGEDFVFGVQILDGYDTITDFKVLVNGSRVVYNNEKEGYWVENVTEDLTISMEGVYKIDACTISIPTGHSGYKVVENDGNTLYSASETVNKGGDFNFKIKLTYADSKVVVKANDIELNKDSNEIYSITNIDEDVEINIEVLYKVTITSNNNKVTIVDASYNAFADELYYPIGSLFEFNLHIDNNDVESIDTITIKAKTANSEDSVSMVGSVFSVCILQPTEILIKVTENVISTYSFNIEFANEVMGALIDMASNEIPDTIVIKNNLNETTSKQYSIDEFMVISNGEEISIMELVQTIESELMILETNNTVTAITCGDIVVVDVASGFITVNWSKLTESSYTLTIQCKAN